MLAAAIPLEAETHRAAPAQTPDHGAEITVSGRAAIDFDNRGGQVLLGHRDPDVEAAACARGLNHTALYTCVAARLSEIIPCAEAVSFFRSGEAALGAATAAARAATGRGRVLSPCANSDAAALAGSADAGDLAAIVVAPVGLAGPRPGYLAQVRDIAHRCGAVLIFDERLTALRIHPGGAQALYGVAPDIAVIGESLANGRPLAALAGHSDLIARAPSAKVTAASLAAALAVLDKIEDEPVIPHLSIQGAELQTELACRIHAHGADALVSVAGDPAMSTLVFAEPSVVGGATPGLNLRDLWLRETRCRGVWSAGDYYMSYAHGDREIARLLDAAEGALNMMVEAARRDDLFVRLRWAALDAELGLQ
ncbi:MAG: aminotransferase class III-fold pyridoxal phosphate-dependent enzyme [Caulobacteraceae bacterium]